MASRFLENMAKKRESVLSSQSEQKSEARTGIASDFLRNKANERNAALLLEETTIERKPIGNGYASVADLNRSTNGSGAYSASGALQQAARELTATLPESRPARTSRTYWDGTTRERNDRGAMLRGVTAKHYDTEGALESPVDRALAMLSGAGAAAVRGLSTVDSAASEDRRRTENALRNLETYTANRDAATTDAERERWQKLADAAQRQIDAYSGAAENKRQNAKDAAEALEATRDNLLRAASEGDYNARAGRALETVEKYGDNRYSDDLVGLVGSNYAVGRLSQNSAYAWDEYLNSPTEENHKIAQTYDLALRNNSENNADALEADGGFQTLIKSAAGYVPQLMDQTAARLKGGAVGLLAGNANAGQAAGAAADMYRITRGAAFRELLNAGIPEEQARAMAKDEAFVSSLIEYADSFAEYAVFGGQNIVRLLMSNGAEAAGTQSGKSAARNALKKLAAYLGNIPQEYAEEYTQEGVSIANENRYASGTTDNGILGLARDAVGTIFGEQDAKKRQQMQEAGNEGARIAALFGLLEAGGGYAAEREVNRRSVDVGAEAISDALNEARTNGAVSDAAAGAVLQNEPVMNLLTRMGEVELTDDMDRTQRTDAVRDALTRLAESVVEQEDEQQTVVEAAAEVRPQRRENQPQTLTEKQFGLRDVSEAQLARDIRTARESFAPTLGREGARAFANRYNEDAARLIAPDEAFKGFNQVYSAALKGEELPEVNIPNSLAYAAQLAGESDRRTAAQAKYFGENAGLAKNRSGYPRNLSSKDERILDNIGKAFGTQIRFADSIVGRDERGTFTSNAKIENGVLTIAKDADDPVRVAFFHEITHRVREVSPEAYAAMSRFVLDNMSDERFSSALRERMERYGSTDISDVSEELVADAYGTILGDSELLDRFAGTNRSAAQRILDAIRDIIVKIRRALSGGSQAMLTEDQKEAFRDLQGREEEMARLLEDALERTRERAAEATAFVGEASTQSEAEASEIKYSRVADKETLDMLNSGDTVKVYRAMQVIDGKLYPPMSAKVAEEGGGKRQLVESTDFGVWYRSDERPDLVDPKTHKFKLDKANGAAIEAAYNPYFHTSATPLNDQFSSAYKRPNLVTVEVEIPKSELTSGYKAEFAKDSVGETKWHAGPVASKLKGEKSRRVFLSRWAKVNRIVPDSEVAQIVAKTLEGENISIPYNVVTPSLRAELEKLGVPIDTKGEKKTATAGGERLDSRKVDSKGRELSEAQAEYFKDSKARDEDGRLLTLYHGGFATGENGDGNVFAGRGSGYAYNPNSIFLTDDVNVAQAFGGMQGRLYELYADIKNPIVLDAQGRSYVDIPIPENAPDSLKDFFLVTETADADNLPVYAQEYGYDGVIIRNVREGVGGEPMTEVIALSPEQVKNVDNQNPTSNPDIRFSRKRTQRDAEAISETRTDMETRLQTLNEEQKILEQKKREFLQSSEYLDFMDSITNAKTKGSIFPSKNSELSEAIEKYAEWEHNSGLSDISRRITELNEEMRMLRNEIERVKKDELEQARAAYRSKFTPEFAAKYAAKAARKFGTTTRFNLAGYLTTNGTLLDFSSRQGYRVNDHREIAEVLDFLPDEHEYSDGMIEFMNLGNIRMQEYGIDISKEPNAKQISVLKRFFNSLDGEVTVDFSKENGDSDGSIDYPEGTRADRIINDIKKYFETGEVPKLSETALFHTMFSRKRGDMAQREAQLLRENDILRQQVDALRGEMRRSDPAGRIDPKNVRKAARELIDYYGSTVKADEITDDMQRLYDLMGTGGTEDNELSYDAAREIADTVARKIAENALDETGSLYADYEELRKFLRDADIIVTAEDTKNITDWNDWRKARMGKVKIKRGETSNIDVVYDELSERWPEFFPGDVLSVEDQLQHMADVSDAIYADRGRNPYDPYMDQAVIGIGNDIMERFFDLPQYKTFADRQEARIEAMREKMSDMRQRHKEAMQRSLDRVRKNRDERLAKQRDRFKAKTEAGRQKQRAAVLRKRIERHAAEMSQKLLRPSDKQHIPEALRSPVAAMLSAINRESSYDYLKSGYFGEKAERVPRGEGDVTTKRTQAFQALKDQYQKALAESDGNMVIDPDLIGEQGSGFQGLFDQVLSYGDTPIRSMNEEQLSTIWKVLRSVEHSITTYGKLMAVQKYKTTEQLANRFYDETARRRDRSSLRGLDPALDLENPYTFFSQYGEAGKSIYRMLRDAQDGQRRKLDEVIRLTQSAVDSETVDKLRKERHEITASFGDHLTITTSQLMEIYLLSKREQALNHLVKGGIVQPEIAKDGKQPRIPRGNQTIRLSLNDLENMIGLLTPEQIRIADALQAITTDVLAVWGNEAAMQAYGYRKFTEPNYWPIKSASEVLHSNVEKDGGNVRSIKNIGMAKAVIPQASNAVNVNDVFDTFAGHTADMLDYSTWLLPMEDAQRFFNFKFKNKDGSTKTTVKFQLDRVGGANGKASRYWMNLMSDIQNGIDHGRGSDTERLVNRIVGNTKAAAVGANLRVVIQQPTAFFRASAVMDPASLTRGLFSGVTGGNAWEKAQQWAGIARIKEAGGFDQGSRRSIGNELYDDRSRIEKLNDAAGWLAGRADAVTWGRLWNAAEWETKRLYPDLPNGSADFYQKAAEIFTDTIDQTQVVDGVLQRSAIMRSGDRLTQQMTSFMGEPIMSLNMLLRAWDNVRYETIPERRGAAIKTLGRSALALLVTDAVNALAQSLVDAARDDDKDKDYGEKFITALTGIEGNEETAAQFLKNVYFGSNFVQNINPLNRLPVLKDAQSVMQGFSVERLDASTISDIIQAHNRLVSGKVTPGYGVYRLIGTVAKLAGIPAVNLERDVLSVVRSAVYATDNYSAMYDLERAIYTPSANVGRFYDVLTLALRDGDADSYQALRERMSEDSGKRSKDIDAAVKSRLTKGGWMNPQAAEVLGVVEKYAEKQEDKDKFSAESLDPAAYTRYNNQRAAAFKELRGALEKTKEFKALSDADKDKAIGWAKAFADHRALADNSGGQYQIDTKWEKAALDAERAGIGAGVYLLFHTVYETTHDDKDADGKKIKGQEKKDKMRAWLESQRGLTNGQREWLWGTVYSGEW